MSLSISNQSILVGETTTLLLSDIYNITVEQNSSIISIEKSGINYYTITVKPNISTIYYISGYNSEQVLINLNGTVYVNITALKNEVTINYNQSLELFVIGSVSYTWYPDTFLNKTNSSIVTCTPTENITYKVTGVDSFLTTSSTKINVIVNTGLIFTPKEPNVLDGDLLVINVNYVKNIPINYVWKSSLFTGLTPNCTTYKYGNSIKLHPYQSISYKVEAYHNGMLVTTDSINITVIEKESDIIDFDILPFNIAQIIINRNEKELIKIMTQNKILSKKIINFYYTTLQCAYKMEWTNKNGISFKIPWLTLCQIKNESNGMILSFKQQWKFFQYININQTRDGITISNFAFLLNVVNKIYLEKPQKIYIVPLQSSSF